MTVVELKELHRKDVPIYYRMVYGARAVIEFAGRNSEIHIEFTIEMTPFGMKQITVTLEDTPEYPLIPLKKELKKKIEELDANDKLPL
jgi:hypothetical protein